MAAALRKAFDSMGNPGKFHTDQGKEFYNSHVKELLLERGVHHFATFQDVKAQIVEHFNHTLREDILQYTTDRQMLHYIDALPDFLYGYNHRPHSAIFPYAPMDVNERNQHRIHELQYGEYLQHKPNKHKYQISDRV